MSSRRVLARALQAAAASSAAGPAAAAAAAAAPPGWFGCLRGLSSLAAARRSAAHAFTPAAFTADGAAAAPQQPPPRPWELPRSPKPVVLPPEATETPVAPRARGDASLRTGILAIKCGMTCDWTAWGERLPLTVLWMDDCQARACVRAGGAWG
jgi:hypothetical protein